MRSLTHIVGLSAIALLVAGMFCVQSAQAQNTKGRQHYDTSWKFNKTANYHHKTFHYKVKKTDTVYKTQVVVYKPTVTKNFVHWYNPETKKYWARCPTVNHPTYGKEVKAGKDYWSLLPDNKKKEVLDDIKEDDYGKIDTKVPPLPGCDDNEHIHCPPTDLPKG